MSTPRVSRSLRRPNQASYHAGPWPLRAWPVWPREPYDSIIHDRPMMREPAIAVVSGQEELSLGLFTADHAGRWHGGPWGCAEWDPGAAREALRLANRAHLAEIVALARGEAQR